MLRSYSDDSITAMTAKSSHWGETSVPNPICLHPQTLLQRHIIALAIMAVLALVAAASGAYSIFTRPRGKIEFNREKAGTQDRRVEIGGYTKHLSLSRHNVWIVVEAPRQKRCWPKQHIHPLNGPFTAEIDTKNHAAPISVSLYAVIRDDHVAFGRWLNKQERTGNREGLPMLPEMSRLDSLQMEIMSE